LVVSLPHKSNLLSSVCACEDQAAQCNEELGSDEEIVCEQIIPTLANGSTEPKVFIFIGLHSPFLPVLYGQILTLSSTDSQSE
jgi:hypothetical protein